MNRLKGVWLYLPVFLLLASWLLFLIYLAVMVPVYIWFPPLALLGLVLRGLAEECQGETGR